MSREGHVCPQNFWVDCRHAVEQPTLMGTNVATRDSLSRRGLLAAATSASTLLAMASKAQAQSPPVQAISPEMRLLLRCTYAPKQSDLQAVQQLGFNAWLERQLSMTDADNQTCESEVARLYPRVYMTFADLRILDDGRTSYEHLAATMYRAIHSERQLYERMVEFWFDHFNIDWHKCSASPTLQFVNESIRPHALGTFPELLSATAHSGAMMAFLDNEGSRAGNPNENYARELMELHTMGVNGGYSESDVKEVARCFTGWATGWQQQPNWREFAYHDIYHEDGVKHVLGHTIPAGGGQQDGERVLQILAHHPSTARFIAKKLVAWFMGIGNFTTLEGAVAQAYSDTGGDIKSMLRVILKPSVLSLAKPKFKRPFHLFAGILRLLGAQVTDFGTVRFPRLSVAGHEQFSWPLPDGYPDNPEHWSGHMLPRWNFVFDVMSRQIREVVVDWKPLIGSAQWPHEIADRINQMLFCGTMPQAEYDRLRDFLSRSRSIARGIPVRKPTDTRIEEALALAMCAPSFQWY